jgi:hypothetical protein
MGQDKGPSGAIFNGSERPPLDWILSDFGAVKVIVRIVPPLEKRFANGQVPTRQCLAILVLPRSGHGVVAPVRRAIVDQSRQNRNVGVELFNQIRLDRWTVDAHE